MAVVDKAAETLKALNLGEEDNLTFTDFFEFKLSGIGSPYLNEQSLTIRDRVIVWDTFFKANMINQVELDKMVAFCAIPAIQLVEALKSDLSLIPLVVTFLQKIVRVDTVQYLLVQLDNLVCSSALLKNYWDSLAQDQKMLESITQGSSDSVVDSFDKMKSLAFTSLTRCLSKDDEFTQLKSAKILVELCLCWDGLPDSTLTALLNWAYGKISAFKASNSTDIALQVLIVLMRRSENRSNLYRYPRAITLLVEFLDKDSNSPHNTYQIVILLWLFTLDADMAGEIQRRFDVVPKLMDTARNAVKEKVVRACVMTLRSLLERAPGESVLPMVGNKVLAMVETFLTRKWTDDDIAADLEYLKAELNNHINQLTTWDEYASEVKSGKLEWSPVHTSENFWKKNVSKLNENDYETLRLLAKILKNSTEPVVLAVACYDIGQYVKYYMRGKKLLQDLGAKQQMMELITHKDAEVRYNALLAVQQYMSNSWDF